MSRTNGEGALFTPAASVGGRFAAFGKFLLFAVAVFLLMGITYAVLISTHLVARTTGAPDHSPTGLLLNEVVMAGAALLTTVVLGALFREPLGTFGFGFRGSPRLRDFLIGAALGFGLLTLLLVSIALLGGFSFGAIADRPMEVLHFGLLYLLLFFLVGVAEEFLMRGYALVQLTRALNFWPAAILLSIGFGAIHAGNAGETPIDLFSAGAIGFVLAYSFWKSGSLMWALGFHAAWDYAQSFVWGVADSGTVLPGALFRSSMHGADWLTGGSVGPEGSWLIVPVILVAGLAAHVSFGGRSSRRFN